MDMGWKEYMYQYYQEDCTTNGGKNCIYDSKMMLTGNKL